MKLVIFGSRDFADRARADRILNDIRSRHGIECVLSGTAKGADQIGEAWAYTAGIPVQRYPADWERHGKQAGFIRNEAMARAATHGVAFWDGESRGTAHMIRRMGELGRPVAIIRFTLSP